MLPIIESNGLKFFCRPNTLDEYVVVEVVRRKLYEKHFDIVPTDIVLDIGGHIGTFACVAGKIASHVVSYEMDLTNFEIMRENIHLNRLDDIETRHFAVWTSTGHSIEYGENTLKNTGAHSIYIRKSPRRTRLAVTASIYEILQEVEPTFVKMDVEGAEQVLYPAILEYLPNKFVMEFHHNAIKDRNLWPILIDQFEKYYPNIVAKRDCGKRWTSMLYAWK